MQFFFCSNLEILECGAYNTGIVATGGLNLSTFKIFEKYLGVTQFIVGRFGKYFLNGEILFLACLSSIENITCICS